MLSLRHLLRSPHAVSRTAIIHREWIEVALADGRRIKLLRVRDPRARRIKLSVDERGARLTLPLRTSLSAGDRFLHEHGDWLRQQLDLQAEHAAQGLIIGQTTTLLLREEAVPLTWQTARTTRLDFDTGTDTHGQLTHGQLRFQLPANAGQVAVRRALRDFYEAQGRVDLGRWLPRYLPGLPRPPRRFLFKRTTGQWGSLAPDGSLSLDLALLLARPSAFEYVLVHELCHLLHANHSPRFWHEVEARYPDWRCERDYLRSEGRALKTRLRALLAG